MRHINFENFKPDEAWLKKSEELTRQLIELHEQGKFDDRNKLIDDYSKHWGEIKEALLKLSHNKCWFSEARDLFSHMEVEHFRPKSEAKELNKKDRGGYWWLAFDYKNYRACGNVGNRKKGGWFPLKDGSLVSTFDNQCEDSEFNYLLDPTNPSDVILIAFDEEGKAIPNPVIVEDWDKRRVEVSVERLKLNEHSALTEERRKIWQEVSQKIEEYYKAKSKCAKGNNPAMKQKMKDVCLDLRKMVREDAILSSVAKWCILFRNDMSLSSLLGG